MTETKRAGTRSFTDDRMYDAPSFTELKSFPPLGRRGPWEVLPCV